MSKFIDYLVGRFDWRYRPGRSIVKNSGKSEQETPGDSIGPESNQRKTTNQDESYHKRVTKYNCPVEPFRETLRILDQLL